MKLRKAWIFTFSALLLIPFFMGNGFAAEGEINSMTTDKETYAAGETITVIGQVAITAEYPVILQIISPNGNFVDLAQFFADDDKTFSIDFETEIGGLWKESGTYVIKGTHYYGHFETQFDFGGMMSAGVKSGETGGEFESGNLNFGPVDEFSESASMIQLEDYALLYEITGAKILKIVPDVENNSLIITIETFNDGELRITLPKEVIDTTEGSFFVLVDGEETNHDANSTTGFWTLVIPFYNGSEEIEIIGTFVIPEFGTIAAIILAVAITSIIVLSAKTKLSIMPKL